MSSSWFDLQAVEDEAPGSTSTIAELHAVLAQANDTMSAVRQTQVALEAVERVTVDARRGGDQQVRNHVQP